MTYDLLTDKTRLDKEVAAIDAVVGIRRKLGKNSVLRGVDLKKEATARERNKLIGGHNGGEEE